MNNDLISRSAAKDEILSWAVIINKPHLLSKEDTLHVLDTLPAVDAGPKWISVKDRLPEVRVPVLTLGRKGAIGIGFIQPTSVKDGKVWFYPRYGDSLPTHWMPLPDVLKEE